MKLKKQAALLSFLVLSSGLLIGCEEKEGDKSDTQDPLSETVVSEKPDYSNISTAVKRDSFLNKIEEYKFSDYFYPTGYSSYDRDILFKKMAGFSSNPYFFDLIYAMTNGDFKEPVIVAEYNKIYEHLVKLNDAFGVVKDPVVINEFRSYKMSLKEFKELNAKGHKDLEAAYKGFQSLSFDTLEGQMLYEFYSHAIDIWVVEFNNQFKRIELLNEDRQSNYNVTDFQLRIAKIGEEMSFIDTYSVLLERTLQDTEKEEPKEKKSH